MKDGMRSTIIGSRLSLVAAAGVVVALFAACGPVDVFSDYRDVDFLSERSVGLPSWTVAYQAGVTPASDYIEFSSLTPAEYGSATGLPAGAPVYRLEIPNLLPDGDFEASTVGNTPTGWTVDALATQFVVEGAPPAEMPDGNYVELQFGSEDNAYFNLSTLSDGYIVDAMYYFQADIKRLNDETSILFDFGNGSTSYLGRDDWRVDPVPGQAIVVESVPDRGHANLNKNSLFFARNVSDRFYVGGPAADSPFIEGYLDNLRIGRHDVFPHVRFELPLTASGTQLEFIPGRYVFSVFVKSELDSQVTPTPSARNRFRSHQLSIGIDELYQTYERSTQGWDESAWTEINYTFDLSATKIADGDPLTVTLSPSAVEHPVVGSILVAAPRLKLDL